MGCSCQTTQEVCIRSCYPGASERCYGREFGGGVCPREGPTGSCPVPRHPGIGQQEACIHKKENCIPLAGTAPRPCPRASLMTPSKYAISATTCCWARPRAQQKWSVLLLLGSSTSRCLLWRWMSSQHPSPWTLKEAGLAMDVPLGCVCVCISCFSRVQLFAIPWTVAHQAPLSMGFSRQEYWSGLPCPPPGDLPNPGIKSMSLTSLALAGGLLTTSTAWEAPWVSTSYEIKPNICCWFLKEPVGSKRRERKLGSPVSFSPSSQSIPKTDSETVRAHFPGSRQWGEESGSSSMLTTVEDTSAGRASCGHCHS